MENDARYEARVEEYKAYCEAQNLDPNLDLMDEHMEEYENNKLLNQDYLREVV